MNIRKQCDVHVPGMPVVVYSPAAVHPFVPVMYDAPEICDVLRRHCQQFIEILSIN